MNEAVLKASLITPKTIPATFSFPAVQLSQFFQPLCAHILSLHCLLHQSFTGLTKAHTALIFLLPAGITPLQQAWPELHVSRAAPATTQCQEFCTSVSVTYQRYVLAQLLEHLELGYSDWVTYKNKGFITRESVLLSTPISPLSCCGVLG